MPTTYQAGLPHGHRELPEYIECDHTAANHILLAALHGPPARRVNGPPLGAPLGRLCRGTYHASPAENPLCEYVILDSIEHQRLQGACSVERSVRRGVSGLSPYVAAVAAGCLGMPSTRCSASHRATDSYTAATARPPALRHEHTSPFPPPSLRSLSRSVWMRFGRASQTRATPAGLILGHDHIRCTITRPSPSPPSSRRPR